MNEPPVVMPEFIRKALLAQGKYDPDEIAQKAAEVDLDAVEQAEQLRLEEERAARRARQADQDSTGDQKKWYDDL